MKSIASLLGTGVLCAVSSFAQYNSVPAGTNVTVRTNDSIDLSNTADGRVYTGVVDQEVRDSSGNVVIPRGANAELIVRDIGNDERAVDLESITAGGRRYIVAATDQGGSRGDQKEGIGKNSRTGKYVGGGAAVGAIIGAIAGGGKGAAIGAVTGAAAGAGAQVLTRGRSGKIPSESLLTFRLDQPLELGRGEYSRDRGYQRNGYHYHQYGNNQSQQDQYRSRDRDDRRNQDYRRDQ